ncbi:MAG: IS110 family transposase [Gemmatimonadota bacterium]
MSTSSSKIDVGMDVHKDTVMVAVLPEDAAKPTIVKQLPNDERKLRRFLSRIAEDGELRCCYEASGAGYVLQRAIKRWGHHCEVIAPALILTRPGHRRKHDRFDAIELAKQHRAGLLVAVRVPSEAEERVRDLVRCRETFQREILKSRHYILKFLRRRGFVFRDGSNWTQKHVHWLRSLLTQEELVAEDQDVLGEYLSLLEYKIDRRDELDRKIEKLAVTPAYQEAVARLRGFRGLDTHGAMVLRSELGDLRRFGSPRQLMAYVGLVPSEHSSGDRENRDSITKAGNSHCRHVLVQAAWSYRYPPRVGARLRERQQGLPPEVVAHSWKAQHRLHKLFRRIEERRGSRIAVVAVARELTGFVWAVLQDVDSETDLHPARAA